MGWGLQHEKTVFSALLSSTAVPRVIQTHIFQFKYPFPNHQASGSQTVGHGKGWGSLRDTVYVKRVICYTYSIYIYTSQIKHCTCYLHCSSYSVHAAV